VTVRIGGDVSEALIQKRKNESQQEILLRLLEHVERGESVSQDGFARQIGIAKGLANAYFNRCLSKGLIKLRQVPKQRFLYYLTPKGFAEKAKLTTQFLTSSYRFYRDARADLVLSFAEAAKLGHRKIAILGCGELAEIAAFVSHETPIEVVGFIVPRSERKILVGRPVVTQWSDIAGADSAMLATIEDAAAALQHFRDEQPAVKVFVPKLLRSLLWKRDTI